MFGKTTKLLCGLIGTILLCIFVIGLAQSISSGFAGFKGGLPFWVIILFVLALAIYDFYEECILGKTWNKNGER
ncbi:hypothetical protein D1F64_04205 [Breoghania sp. L-A4]|nr:hypothetical protein D1F64_04205 [Breoghania sp. L-A4]